MLFCETSWWLASHVTCLSIVFYEWVTWGLPAKNNNFFVAYYRHMLSFILVAQISILRGHDCYWLLGMIVVIYHKITPFLLQFDIPRLCILEVGQFLFKYIKYYYSKLTCVANFPRSFIVWNAETCSLLFSKKSRLRSHQEPVLT